MVRQWSGERGGGGGLPSTLRGPFVFSYNDNVASFFVARTRRVGQITRGLRQQQGE